MSDVISSKSSSDTTRVTSPFEFWPGWIFYAPVVLYWIYLGIRFRSLSLATAANPTITSGGLCGESKSSILDQIGRDQRIWVAEFVKVVTGRDDATMALERMRERNIGFPVVAKPDVGCHGNGVRLVTDLSALQRVLTDYPAGVDLLLQEFVPFEGEAGVFYVRLPGLAPQITSLTLKQAPCVRGDGRSTLRELIQADERASILARLFYPRLRDQLDDVVPAGRLVRLVFTGNHCKGSVFKDGRSEITSSLTTRIDEICGSMPQFYFGRVDLRFNDIAALRRGDNFRIIEVNGVGSEATHIWDPQTSLVDAYRAQFGHYKMAFTIGDQMRRAGYRPTTLLDLLKLWRRQTRLMASYPRND